MPATHRKPCLFFGRQRHGDAAYIVPSPLVSRRAPVLLPASLLLALILTSHYTGPIIALRMVVPLQKRVEIKCLDTGDILLNFPCHFNDKGHQIGAYQLYRRLRVSGNAK